MHDEIETTPWQPLPPLPHLAACKGYALASSRDALYLSGGISKTALRSLHRLDASSGEWTELGGMTHRRFGHGLAVAEGGRYLFAVGGWGYRSHQEKKEKRSLLKKVLGRKDKVVDDASTEENSNIEKLKSYEVYDASKGVWREAGELNESRRDFGIAADSISGRIYVFGGIGEDGEALRSAEVYNPFEGGWDPLKPMPRAVEGAHPVIVGSRIYLYERQSGKRTLAYDRTADRWIDADPDETLPRCPADGRIVSASSFSGGQVRILVHSYPVKDPSGRTSDRWLVARAAAKRTKTWTVLPPAGASARCRTAVSNGKLVVVAGDAVSAFHLADETDDDASTVVSSRSSRSGSLRDPSALSSGGRGPVEPVLDDGTWTPQPDFPSKPPDFRGYAVASVGELVYVSGGCSGDGTVYRSFLGYNVKSKKWKKLPGMTHRRLGHRMAVSPDGRYVYVVGGGDGKRMRSMGVDIYDSIRECWTAAPGMNDYRVFFGATVCDGRIFAFGGVGADNGNQLKTVEMFDPDTFSWEFVASMPEARGVCNVITVDEKIFVFGTPSQKVLAYDTAADKWVDDATLDDLSLPSCPPGGCVCASSSYVGGEVLVIKYPLEGTQGGYRRVANVYDAIERTWSSVHLLDTFACYSAVVAGDKCVVVTPNNQLQVCAIPKN